MKLIETPINSNLNMENVYPNITKFIFDKKAIKYYKFYSLDRNQIIYADLFDKEVVVMINTKKKITKNEIDFVRKRLLRVAKDEVKITFGIKEKMKNLGYTFTKPRKDIILIEKRVQAS